MGLLPAFDGLAHTPDMAWFDHHAPSQLGNCAAAVSVSSSSQPGYAGYADNFGLDEQTLRHVQAMYDPNLVVPPAQPAPQFGMGSMTTATSTQHMSNPPTPLSTVDQLPQANYSFPAASPGMYSPVNTELEALLKTYTLPSHSLPPNSFASAGAGRAVSGSATSVPLQHPSPLRAVSAPSGPVATYGGSPSSTMSQMGAMSPTPALTHCSTVQSTPHQLTPHHRSLSSCSTFSSLSLPPAQHSLGLHPLTRAAGSSTAANSGATDKPNRAFFCTADPACPRATRSFLSNADLKRHLNSHEGKKPYTCDVPGCGRRYGQNYRLITHMQKHHPEINVDERRSRASSTRAQVLARRKAIEASGIAGNAAARQGLSGLGLEMQLPLGRIEASGYSRDMRSAATPASDPSASAYYPSPATTFTTSYSAASTPASSDMSMSAGPSGGAAPFSAPAATQLPQAFASLPNTQSTPTPSPSTLLKRRRTAPYPALSLPLQSSSKVMYTLPPGFGGFASR
ncbi:hypothetical protein Q5752_002847 [Cryptotrichosporon argae]